MPNGRRVLAFLCPPCFHLSQGEHRSSGFVCLGALGCRALCCSTRAPRGASSPEGNMTQPPMPAASQPNNWLLPNAPESCGAPALYRYRTRFAVRLAPGAPTLISDSGNLEASWLLLRFSLISLLSIFPSRKILAQIFKVPAYPGLGFCTLEAFAALL